MSLDTPFQKLADAMNGLSRGSVKTLKPADPRVGTDSLSLNRGQEAEGEETTAEETSNSAQNCSQKVDTALTANNIGTTAKGGKNWQKRNER